MHDGYFKAGTQPEAPNAGSAQTAAMLMAQLAAAHSVVSDARRAGYFGQAKHGIPRGQRAAKKRARKQARRARRRNKR